MLQFNLNFRHALAHVPHIGAKFRESGFDVFAI